MTPTRENRSTMRKIYPNANLSTTNPTRTGRELNPVICGGRSATNHLKYDRSNDTVTVFMFEISHGGCCKITVFQDMMLLLLQNLIDVSIESVFFIIRSFVRRSTLMLQVALLPTLYTEGEVIGFPPQVGKFIRNYTASHKRRKQSSAMCLIPIIVFVMSVTNFSHEIFHLSKFVTNCCTREFFF